MSRTDNTLSVAHAAALHLPLPGPPPPGPRPEQATDANMMYLDRFHATMARKLPPGTPVAPYLAIARRISLRESVEVVAYHKALRSGALN